MQTRCRRRGETRCVRRELTQRARHRRAAHFFSRCELVSELQLKAGDYYTNNTTFSCWRTQSTVFGPTPSLLPSVSSSERDIKSYGADSSDGALDPVRWKADRQLHAPHLRHIAATARYTSIAADVRALTLMLSPSQSGAYHSHSEPYIPESNPPFWPMEPRRARESKPNEGQTLPSPDSDVL